MTVLTRALRVTEGELLAYKRSWRGTVISSFVNPIFFLSAMGMGIGALVDRGDADLGVPYLVFVATGLMAANAMQSGSIEGAFPVMAGIKWRKEYHAIVTTPISSADILLGRTIWGTFRLTFILLVFTLIAGALGALDLRTALLAVPPAALTGLAFTLAMTAFTVNLESDMGLTQVFRFVIMPLFLFSGTFFPISNLPQILQNVAFATPLFHGVELVRKIALPDPTGVVTDLPMWVHALYLVTMGAIGFVIAARGLDRRLRP